MAYPDGSRGPEPEGRGGSRRAWWQSAPVVVVSAVVAVVLAATLGVAAASRSGTTSSPASPVTPTQAPASGSATPVPTASPTDSSSPESTEPTRSTGATMAVYYVKQDGPRYRLYREFHRAKDSSVLSALRDMVGAPQDPDYSTLWRGATVTSYTRSGSTATVKLSGAPDTAGNLDGDVVTAAVQQIVYTVTAVEADAALAVTVQVDGKPLAPPTKRAARVETEGLVWLTAPVEAASTRSPVRLQGIASTFEATVAWEVRKGSATGSVVAHGSATASEAGPARAPWSASVTLPPGTYVVRAWAPDESGGDAAPVGEDTKRIVVTS